MLIWQAQRSMPSQAVTLMFKLRFDAVIAAD